MAHHPKRSSTATIQVYREFEDHVDASDEKEPEIPDDFIGDIRQESMENYYLRLNGII